MFSIGKEKKQSKRIEALKNFIQVCMAESTENANAERDIQNRLNDMSVVPQRIEDPYMLSNLVKYLTELSVYEDLKSDTELNFMLTDIAGKKTIVKFANNGKGIFNNGLDSIKDDVINWSRAFYLFVQKSGYNPQEEVSHANFNNLVNQFKMQGTSLYPSVKSVGELKKQYDILRKAGKL